MIADSREFAHKAMAAVAPVSEVHIVGTGEGIDGEESASLEERGARVVLV